MAFHKGETSLQEKLEKALSQLEMNIKQPNVSDADLEWYPLDKAILLDAIRQEQAAVLQARNTLQRDATTEQIQATLPELEQDPTENTVSSSFSP